MPLVAMFCASLLGLADGTPPPPPPAPADVAAEYRHASAAAGRGSAEQVRLALWCEAHGLSAERARHLALAVLADPGNALARGLAGLVARDGRWAAPEAVARSVRSDPATAAALAEYDERRSKAAYTADGQWALAQWADEHGLRDQARAHLTAVARLDPSRDAAWKRLGYKKVDGRWATDAQVAAARAEAEAQKAADKSWRLRLERWRGMLARPPQRDEAKAALLGVTDPRAVPSIWSAFAGGDAADQAVAVQLFGQVDGGAASLALAELAIRGRTPEVRRVATETLTLRDPRDFVGPLVRRIRTPWKYEVRRPVDGPGSVGELFLDGERYNVRRIYAPPQLDLARVPRLFDASVPLGAMGPQSANFLGASILSQASLINQWNGRGAGVGGLSDTSAMILNYEVAAARRDLQIQQQVEAYRREAQLSQQQLEANVRTVEATNAAILALNGRILPILARTTGQNFGDDHKAWDRWSTEQAGYAFQESTSEKPTYTEVADIEYGTRPAHACFAAGTPVRTVDGTKPIEHVRRGDLVLVQDTASGALSYQPVLTAFHTPPSTTYRVKLGGDEVRATGIHRFWRAGRGWAMARDLRPGDALRVLGGVASVESVSPERSEPVFNLEVAEGRSFFVGRVGALVHDNSLVEATPEPFDAPGAAGAVAAATKPDATR